MPATKIEVSRKVHIAAPEDAAIYASPCYAAASGARMIETVREAAMHVKPDGSKHYYAKRIYERHSEDNGRTWVEGAEIQRTMPGQLEAIQRFVGPTVLDPINDIMIQIHACHGREKGQKTPLKCRLTIRNL